MFIPRYLKTSRSIINNSTLSSFSSGSINGGEYIHNKADKLEFKPKCNKAKGISGNHRFEPWTLEEVSKSNAEHVVYTWGATDPSRDSAIAFERGEGVYLFDYSGKKYMDMSS